MLVNYFIIILLFSIIILCLLLFIVYQKITNAYCKSTKRLDGKTVLVTGGTAGMGLLMSTEFARRGARVIIACPYEEEGMNAKHHIIKETNNKNVVFKCMDLASLTSVREFAADILVNEKRLDVLVNNAGTGLIPEYITKDGLNNILQINYYGTFLLSLLLLPLLKKTGNKLEPSRIVNTSSMTHWLGRVELEHINKIGYYTWFHETYSNAKLCVVLFTRELARRLKNEHVVVNAIDPGAVGTKFFTYNYKIVGHIIMYGAYCIFKTPWQGIQTALFASLDEKVNKISGEFLKECRVYRASSKVYDDKMAAVLWEDSLKLVKLSEVEIAAIGL